MMKRWLLIIAAGLLALLLGVALRLYGPTLPITDSPLPNFSFPDLSGKQRNISEWRGKILVVNFWATWCPPCREEIPELIAMQRQYADQGLQIVGIAIEDQDTVSAFAQKNQFNYPILVAGDGGMALSQQLGNFVGAIPFTVVADAGGQIVYRRPGQMTKERLLEIIEPLLALP